jgi:hypothetical protein
MPPSTRPGSSSAVRPDHAGANTWQARRPSRIAVHDPVRAGQCAAHDRPHQRPACASPRCRSMPVSSIRVQAVHPDPADEPRTNDQEGLTAFWRSGPRTYGQRGGIRTRDLWVMSKDGTVQPGPVLRGTKRAQASAACATCPWNISIVPGGDAGETRLPDFCEKVRDRRDGISSRKVNVPQTAIIARPRRVCIGHRWFPGNEFGALIGQLCMPWAGRLWVSVVSCLPRWARTVNDAQ